MLVYEFTNSFIQIIFLLIKINNLKLLLIILSPNEHKFILK